MLHGADAQALEQHAAEAMKVMAAHDGAFFEETYNLLNAWLAIVPGNSAHNLRRLALLETNYADLSFLFTLDQREPISSASSAARRSRSSRRRTRRRTPSTCTSRTSATRSCWAPPAAARASCSTSS